VPNLRAQASRNILPGGVKMVTIGRKNFVASGKSEPDRRFGT